MYPTMLFQMRWNLRVLRRRTKITLKYNNKVQFLLYTPALEVVHLLVWVCVCSAHMHQFEWQVCVCVCVSWGVSSYTQPAFLLSHPHSLTLTPARRHETARSLGSLVTRIAPWVKLRPDNWWIDCLHIQLKLALMYSAPGSCAAVSTSPAEHSPSTHTHTHTFLLVYTRTKHLKGVCESRNILPCKGE